MPAPQALPDALVEEGRAIPVARVAAMHEGKRRARARRAEAATEHVADPDPDTEHVAGTDPDPGTDPEPGTPR